MSDKYFCWDLETTSTDVTVDEPVEIGLTEVGLTGKFDIRSYFIATKVPMSRGAQKVHGIKAADYADGVDPKIMALSIDKYFQDHDIVGLVGFNLWKFDAPMLNNFIKRHGGKTNLFDYPIEDPALWYLAEQIFGEPRPTTNKEYERIANMRSPYGVKWNLKHVAETLKVKVPEGEFHRAAYDVAVTIEVWRKMRSISVRPKRSA